MLESLLLLLLLVVVVVMMMMMMMMMMVVTVSVWKLCLLVDQFIATLIM
jgi:hypothetical protein